MAARPVDDGDTVWPTPRNISVIEESTWESSSTTRTRASRRVPLGCAGPAGVTDAVPTGKMSVNVVPWPGEVSTRISPPCRRTIEYVMDRPRPEPASPLVEKNGSKMRCRMLSDMPTPVSATVTRTARPGGGRGAGVSGPAGGGAALGLGVHGVRAQVGQRLGRRRRAALRRVGRVQLQA